MLALQALLNEPLKGLLFDLDGTLVDSVPDLAVAVDEILSAGGLPLAGEQRVRAWVGNGARKLVLRALAYAQQCDEPSVSKADLDHYHHAFLNAYRQCSSQHSCLYDGVLPALKAWQQQGIKMALVTNKPAEFIKPLLQRFKIDAYFSVLVGGDTLANSKPHPAPLHFACEQLGLSSQQCIMLGDSSNDVKAARAAHMPVACVSYGYNHGEPISQANPDIIVDSLEALSR